MRWKVFSKLVMVEQTLFALPWTLVAALLPFCSESFAASFKWTEWTRWVYILIAFCAARSAGMAFNRMIDKEIDAENPRTVTRTLPAGEATVNEVSIVAWLNVGVFMFACACLNKSCFFVSPLVVVLLWLYSYTKRYTALCHLVLGIVQFFGPFFAWMAITDSWGIPPVLLGLAVLASITAVDIIYALQDVEFDRTFGLHSIPVALGAQNSLWIARLLHLLTIWLLFQVAYFLDANVIFRCGIFVIAAIYIYFHLKIDPKKLKKIDQAFFFCNASVGLTLLFFTLGSLVWRVL